MDLSHNHPVHLYDCPIPTWPNATFDNNGRMEGYMLQQHNPSLTTSEWMSKHKYAFEERKTPLRIYDGPQSYISRLTTNETHFGTYKNLLQPSNFTEILNPNLKLADSFNIIDNNVNGEVLKFEENVPVLNPSFLNPIDVISESNRLKLCPDTYDYPINNFYNNIYTDVNIITPHFIDLTESSEDDKPNKYPNYLSYEKENIYSESFKSNVDTIDNNPQLNFCKFSTDSYDSDIKTSSTNNIQNITNSLNTFENQQNYVPYTAVSTKSDPEQNNIDNFSKSERENSTDTNKYNNKGIDRFNDKKETVNAEAFKAKVDVCNNKGQFLNANSSTTALENSAVLNPTTVRYTIDNCSQRKRLKLSSDDKDERIDFSADENLLLLSNFSDKYESTVERESSTSRESKTNSDVRKHGKKRRRDSSQTSNAPKKFRSEVNVPVGAHKERLESRNHLNWELYNFSKPEDCFEAVRSQWITSFLPNPHEDTTCRFYNYLPGYNSKFTIQGSTDNIVECLSVYENQIMQIEHEISSIEYTLDNFGSTFNRRTINQNLERWNKLKGMKERLNDACEDAHRFYTYYRDDRTGWNAYYISEYHNNEIKHQFDVMNAYEDFYGFS
ncbi:hypothetical protein FQR65_LT05529 [Abscondita terminalis]|nr:hypothetical protein FQR65_LT05529 [Abscondita terminalis]